MLMMQYIKGTWIFPSFTYFNCAVIVVVGSGWVVKEAVALSYVQITQIIDDLPCVFQFEKHLHVHNLIWLTPSMMM